MARIKQQAKIEKEVLKYGHIRTATEKQAEIKQKRKEFETRVWALKAAETTLPAMSKRRRLEEEIFCFRCGKEIAKCQCDDVALTQKEELRRLKLKIIELEKKVYKLEGYYEDMTALKGDFAEIVEKKPIYGNLPEIDIDLTNYQKPTKCETVFMSEKEFAELAKKPNMVSPRLSHTLNSIFNKD